MTVRLPHPSKNCRAPGKPCRVRIHRRRSPSASGGAAASANVEFDNVGRDLAADGCASAASAASASRPTGADIAASLVKSLDTEWRWPGERRRDQLPLSRRRGYETDASTVTDAREEARRGRERQLEQGGTRNRDRQRRWRPTRATTATMAWRRRRTSAGWSSAFGRLTAHQA